MKSNEEKEYKRLWYLKNKEKVKAKSKSWKEENREKKAIADKEYREKNKGKNKEWLAQNTEKRKVWRKGYREKNKKKIAEYERNKRLTDSVYWLKAKLRSVFSKALKEKGYTKNSRSYEILGCTFEEFKIYLESKFEPWMNWENRGLYNGQPNYGWDIDHIIPLREAKTKEDVIKLNHYTNLQPLCSYTNRDIKK